jgi:hypothetical protein
MVWAAVLALAPAAHAATFDAAVTPTTSLPGRAVIVSGRAPWLVSGIPFLVEQRSGAGWRRLAAARVGAHGAVRARVRLGGLGAHQLRIVAAARKHLPGATSRVLDVHVVARAYRISAQLRAPRRPLIGDQVQLRGVVEPAAPLVVEYQSASGWTQLASVRSAHSGAYTARVSVPQGGPLALRVREPRAGRSSRGAGRSRSP